MSGFLYALHSKSESSLVIEGRYLSRNLNNRIAHRCQTVGAVCISKDFTLDNAGPVANGDEFHRFTILLEMPGTE
ncbi:MAG: hypothetical protein OJI67_22655 [Prosthecobacter sp.]|nr:hypothetical protein [Prosthecobacter sp.]